MNLWDRFKNLFRSGGEPKKEKTPTSPVPGHIRTFRSKKLNPDHVKLLNQAIRNNSQGKNHNIVISYRKPTGEVTKRSIKPISVRGTKQLGAHCNLRDSFRTFRVDRIESVKQAFWRGFRGDLSD